MASHLSNLSANDQRVGPVIGSSVPVARPISSEVPALR